MRLNDMQVNSLDHVIFKNARGMIKHWGAAKPELLRQIFYYLNGSGFQGPISWRDPSSLCFIRKIDDDISIRVILNSRGEFPSGIFSFGTHILVCSKYVFEIDKALDLWERNLELIEYLGNEKCETLWTVDLSHLKWNAVQGENPRWYIQNQVSTSAEVKSCNWLSDWKTFGESYVARIQSSVDVIDMLLDIPHYQASPWVKSDGPTGVAVYENAAILLAGQGQFDVARSILDQFQNAVLTSSVSDLSNSSKFTLRRICKLLDWIAEDADPSERPQQ